jgi:hypothetical protein
MDVAILPALQSLGHYIDPEDADKCYEDRRNWRALWGELIALYNHSDPTRLAREVLRDAGVYVGMRRWVELRACLEANLFDVIYWVDAGDRVQKRDESLDVSPVLLAAHPARTCPIVVIDSSGAEGDWRVNGVVDPL